MLISTFVFATQIVQFLFFLNLNFLCSSLFMWLFMPFCVRPGLKAQSPFFNLIYLLYLNRFAAQCDLLLREVWSPSHREDYAPVSAAAGIQNTHCWQGKYGLPLTEKIMPQYLQQLGYRTHIVGKVSMVSLSQTRLCPSIYSSWDTEHILLARLVWSPSHRQDYAPVSTAAGIQNTHCLQGKYGLPLTEKIMSQYLQQLGYGKHIVDNVSMVSLSQR